MSTPNLFFRRRRLQTKTDIRDKKGLNYFVNLGVYFYVFFGFNHHRALLEGRPFSKIGCRGQDKYAHLKMVMAVGAVMGMHAAYEIFVGGPEISVSVILTYLPVSALYIVSITIYYLGLRYIELSISSPICNSSGALVAVLILITGGIGDVSGWQLIAVALVCAGVVGLGIVEAREDDDLRALRQEASNYKYAKSALALGVPGYTVAGSWELCDSCSAEAERGFRQLGYERIFCSAPWLLIYVVLEKNSL